MKLGIRSLGNNVFGIREISRCIDASGSTTNLPTISAVSFALGDLARKLITAESEEVGCSPQSNLLIKKFTAPHTRQV